jgi:hypothetical protein
MECLPVLEALERPEWTYEILCGILHKVSCVELAVMLRFALKRKSRSIRDAGTSEQEVSLRRNRWVGFRRRANCCA